MVEMEGGMQRAWNACMNAWKKINTSEKGRRKRNGALMVYAWYACMYGNGRECVSPMVLAKQTGHVNLTPQLQLCRWWCWRNPSVSLLLLAK